MIELENIPHIGEISNHGLYHGARQKNTATFQARSPGRTSWCPPWRRPSDAPAFGTA